MYQALRGDGRTNLRSGRTIPDLLKHVNSALKLKLGSMPSRQPEQALSVDNFSPSVLTRGLEQSRVLAFFTISLPAGRVMTWNRAMSEFVAPKKAMLKNLMPMILHPGDIEKMEQIIQRCLEHCKTDSKADTPRSLEIGETVRFLCAHEYKIEGEGAVTWQYTAVELGKAQCMTQTVNDQELSAATFSAFVPGARPGFTSSSWEKKYFM